MGRDCYRVKAFLYTIFAAAGFVTTTRTCPCIYLRKIAQTRVVHTFLVINMCCGVFMCNVRKHTYKTRIVIAFMAVKRAQPSPHHTDAAQQEGRGRNSICNKSFVRYKTCVEVYTCSCLCRVHHRAHIGKWPRAT